MPRRLRIHVPFGFYHVTQRGNHQQDVFFDTRDRACLNHLVADVIRQFGARVHAYCWMTNHIHMLIQVGEVPLSRIMLHIASRYARKVQTRFATRGHLFEKRHDARLVDVDAYLLEVIRYIHLNPVRAGLTTTPGDYPWSSHGTYLGLAAQPWVTTCFALAMFHSRKELAIAAYRAFVEEGPVDAGFPEESQAADPRIIGSDEFVATVIERQSRTAQTQCFDEVIEEVCRELGVSLAELESTRRCRRAAKARALIAARCVRSGVASLARVARRFERDESTLRQSMRRYYPNE